MKPMRRMPRMDGKPNVVGFAGRKILIPRARHHFARENHRPLTARLGGRCGYNGGGVFLALLKHAAINHHGGGTRRKAGLPIFNHRLICAQLIELIGRFHLIATRAPNKRDLWLFLITIPFWTNILIRTFAMQEVIRNEGIVNSALMGMGLVDQPVQIMFTDWAILFGMVYVYLPLMVLPLYASMEKLDFRLVEAGYDLYANRLQVLRRIIIPLVKPGIVAGCILVFIPSLGAYVIPRVLGGGKNMMLGNLIDLQFGQGRNWPLGSALSITLMIIVTLALLVYVRNTSKGGGHGHV